MPAGRLGIRHCLLLCLLAGAGLSLEAATPQVRYHFDHWKTQQGLPQNTVKSILQTSDGYLWIATQGGLARFDGVRFRVFDQANTPELISDSFVSLAEDPIDSSLWLISPRGVARFKNSKFKYTDVSRRADVGKLWAIHPRKAGGAWIACDKGLKYVDPEFQKLLDVPGAPQRRLTRALLEDAEGRLWIGSQVGVDRYDPGTGTSELIWRKQPEERESPDNQPVVSLARSREGAIWIGTSDRGLWKYQAGKVTPVATNSVRNIRQVYEDKEGTVWVVQSEGELNRLHDGVYYPDRERAGLNGDNVLCVQDDFEGNVWVGTQFGGLTRMQRSRFLTYSVADGLPNRNAWTIAAGRGDRLWFGTDGGLTRFENGVFTNWFEGADPETRKIKAVLEDRDGNVWAASRNAGLHMIRGGEPVRIPFGPSTNRTQISSLFEDRSGAVWMGTSAGLHRFRNGVLDCVYTVQDGLPVNDVRGMHETAGGDLLIATYGGGLSRLREGRLTTLPTNGLLSTVTWIIREDLDEPGVLWIGSNNGLTRMKDDRFHSFSRTNGLFDNTINDVLDDGHGHLWIGCNRGIFRVAKKELDEVARSVTNRVQYIAFGESDGMLTSETNGENQPAALRTRDGRLWFPTMRGIVVIDPSQPYKNKHRPPVVIEEVRIDRDPLNLTERAILPPGSGSVAEFHFTANSLTAPDKVLFDYWLEGHQKDWVRSTTRREVTYANLSPGRYTFRVRACNNHGEWNDFGTAYSFVIQPHFYQTPWFYGGAALFIVLGFVGVHRFRVNVVRKIGRLERQNALEQERTRIAREMHDDLGSSLTQIALTSELAGREFTDQSAAAGHLRNISSTTREVFRAMDEIVWAVNPRHDTLDSLVAYIGRFAQGFLQTAGIRCRLDLPTEVPGCNLTAEQRHNLFLAVKEGLNNVVRHARASEVWIRVAADPSECVIAIEDNGRGIDSRTARAEGNGLQNMRTRLNAIGGKFEIRTSAEQGTHLRMTVRLKHPHTAFVHE